MSEPMLDVQDLHYTYSDGTHALHGVSFSMAAGERVGVVGPNGSGKSTLLLCLSGLFHGRGTIRVHRETLSPRNARQLRDHVGLVFQSPDDQLFMPTLSEDIAFGPVNQGLEETKVRDRVQEAARKLGLDDLLDRPPHHLSLGQKRNAAIATVLAMSPSLLLMDEPSSNLDPRSRRRLIDVLASLDAALLIASHDLALIGQLCQRVILLVGGRVVAEGASRGLLTDAELMLDHGLDVWHPPSNPVE